MLRTHFLAGVASFAAVAPSQERRLRLAALPFAHDIDPYRDAQSGADELAWLYADGLVGEEAGGLVPLLAARLPEVSEHGLGYRYELRDVRWHDGRRLVAEDVAQAFATVRQSAWGTREPYRSVRDVVVRDGRRFDVILDSPYRRFVRSFFGPHGTPAMPLIRHTDAGLPLGTGPFVVRARPEVERWVLERHTGSPRGAPALSRIDVRLLASEKTAAVQMLTGEADIALPLSPLAAPDWRFAKVRRQTSVAVLMCNVHGVMSTPVIRRALAATLDVPRMQRRFDRARTEVLASLEMSGPNDAAYAQLLTHDPAAAETLRRLLGGREIVVTSVAESPSHGRVIAELADTFEREHVAYRVSNAPAIRYESDGPLRSGRFDLAVNGLAYVDDLDLAADWSCAMLPPAGGNFARYCDPAFDAAVDRGDTRAALRRLYDDMVCIPLTRAYEDIGLGPRVRGFDLPPPGTPATYGCTRWDVT